MSKICDVALIGAGPIGIECAIACKRAGISYLHFDRGQAAQMIYNFPPETRFFSSSERIAIANIPIQTRDQQKCSREDYLAYLRAVVMHYQLNIRTFEDVISIQKQDGRFLLTTLTASGEHTHQARTLILATGGTATPRLLNIPGEQLPHVSSRMADPHLYFQKRLLIIGGRNSAAENALRCFHAGAHVHIAFRGEAFNPNDVKYWLLPELLGYIEKGEIKCFYGTEVKEILPDAVRLCRADGREEVVPIDFVVKAIGFEADMRLFAELGVKLSTEQHAPHYNTETMETNVPNVFALGTAIGGTQKKYRVFIENCHIHVHKVVRTLCARLGKEEVPLEMLYVPKRMEDVRLEE